MRGSWRLSTKRRRSYLILLVVAVTIVSLTAVYFETPLLKGQGYSASSTTASLVINFGNGNVPSVKGHTVTWSETSGKWGYTLTSSNVTEFIFENVTIMGNTVWPLMLKASQIANQTTGNNLTFGRIYYPEFGEYLITGIDGVNNTNTLFWQYEVNGTPAAYGVQLQKVSNGDVVSWALSPQ